MAARPPRSDSPGQAEDRDAAATPRASAHTAVASPNRFSPLADESSMPTPRTSPDVTRRAFPAASKDALHLPAPPVAGRSDSTASAATSTSSASSMSWFGGSAASCDVSITSHELHTLIAQASTNVYCRGVPSAAKDEDLLRIAEPFGSVLSAKTIVDLKTGVGKGLAFVLFASREAADAFIAWVAQNPYALGAVGNVKMQASLARASFAAKLKCYQDEASTNVYLSNLPLAMDEKQLARLLSAYGTVHSARILRHAATGDSRGVGFARFDQRSEALAAIAQLNRAFLPGGTAALSVRFADSPEQRRLKIAEPAPSKLKRSPVVEGDKHGRDGGEAKPPRRARGGKPHSSPQMSAPQAAAVAPVCGPASSISPPVHAAPTMAHAAAPIAYAPQYAPVPYGQVQAQAVGAPYVHWTGTQYVAYVAVPVHVGPDGYAAAAAPQESAWGAHAQADAAWAMHPPLSGMILAPSSPPAAVAPPPGFPALEQLHISSPVPAPAPAPVAAAAAATSPPPPPPAAAAAVSTRTTPAPVLPAPAPFPSGPARAASAGPLALLDDAGEGDGDARSASGATGFVAFDADGDPVAAGVLPAGYARGGGVEAWVIEQKPRARTMPVGVGAGGMEAAAAAAAAVCGDRRPHGAA